MLSLYNVTAGQAAHYFDIDNYYARKEGVVNSQWWGKGAALMGLAEGVKSTQFDNLLKGFSPSGDQFLRGRGDQKSGALPLAKIMTLASELSEMLGRISNLSSADRDDLVAEFKRGIHSKEYQDLSRARIAKAKISVLTGPSKELDRLFQSAGKSTHQRAGIDATFSAPKSVTLAAFVGGDARLLEAHNRAVRAALNVLEKRYSNTRVGGKNDRAVVTTGNLVAATFQHDTSRAKDPQLHTHCVILNLTQRKDKKWRSHYADEIWKNSKFLGTVYQNELAAEALKLGYQVETQSNGTFEIKGYTREQLEVFSKRREQVLQEGGANQKLARSAVLKSRASKGKEIPREVLQVGWKIEAAEAGIIHPQYNLDKKNEMNTQSLLGGISQRLIRAAEMATERTVATRRENIETAAMAQNLGEVAFRDFEIKLSRNRPAEIKNTADEKKYVTDKSIEKEVQYLGVLERGQGQFQPVLKLENARIVADIINLDAQAQGEKGLTNGQRQAIEMTLSARDRVVGWQGVAGAGKTYSMRAVRKEFEKNGITVVAVAPTATATENMGKEAGIESTNTVAKLLTQTASPNRAQGKEVWIVDEAGLLSAKDMNKLLHRAELENARVVLVGDKRQLPSVEAGSPFRHLQDHGMKVAYLSESMRHKTAYLQQAAKLMSAGKMLDGLKVLDREEKILEFENQSKIVKKIRNDFLSLSEPERKNTIILTGTNLDRKEITQAIREGLKEEGTLKNEATLTVFTKRDTYERARTLASTYDLGEWVLPYRRGQGMQQGKPYEVTARIPEENKITVRDEQGKEFSVKPAFLKAEIYSKQEIEIAEGDKMRWTKIHKIEGVERNNGEEVRVKKIENGFAHVQDERGRPHVLPLSEAQHLDHSWVKTTYSAQGLTCDRVMVAATSMVDRESIYVGLTRARQEAMVYTIDKKEFMAKASEISVTKETAEELIIPSQFAEYQRLDSMLYSKHLNSEKTIDNERAQPEPLQPEIEFEKELEHEIELDFEIENDLEIEMD